MRYLSKAGIYIFLLTVSTRLVAQAASIHGSILDVKGLPLASSNVLLLKAADSSVVKATITDKEGNYHFTGIDTGSFMLSASFTGMHISFTKVFWITTNNDNIDVGELLLFNTDNQLKNVVVTGRKPLIEQRTDRVIINVKNSITNVTGSALDILEKSPGVTVNRQDNSIAINGKNGVSVMINGKINYMPVDALVQLLSGTAAANIERIELITTPPSKYDAGGSGGYINIVFVNNPLEGFNGSYFVAAGVAKNILGDIGGNFNYRSSRINIYGNYAYNHVTYTQPFRYTTDFSKASEHIINSSFADRDARREFNNARLGIDYQPDSSTIIGALISGYTSRWVMAANTGASISRNSVPDTIIRMTDDPEYNKWNNIMTNLNFQHKFKSGSVFSADANYIYYIDDNPNTYFTDYYKNASEFLFHSNTRSGKITPINFKVFSADYSSMLGKVITMETGVKLSLNRFTNNITADSLVGTNWIPDASGTGGYLLKEDISAIYGSLSFHTSPSIQIKAGLRYEYTLSDLRTDRDLVIVHRKYGELFPVFSITKGLNNGKNISLSYNRRITRPAFNSLAPFTIFFDPKTFFTGNSALQPAIANTVQATYSLKNLTMSVSYTYEDNTIGNFQFQSQRLDTVSNNLYLSPRNFKYSEYVISNFSLPITVSRKWSMQNSINIGWRNVDATQDNNQVKLHFFEYAINSTQRFVVSHGLTFEISGMYSDAGYFGTSKASPLYRIDAAIQKKMKNKKDVISITGNDIFNTGSYYRYSEQLPGGAHIKASFNYGVVAFKIGFTHQFGKNSLKTKRDRTTSAADELNRVN